MDFCRVAKNPTNTLIFTPAHRSKLPGTSTQEADLLQNPNDSSLAGLTYIDKKHPYFDESNSEG